MEIITETLGLRRADGTKTLSSPGTKRSIGEVKGVTDLSEDQTRTYRIVCMIINYVAQDRPDILFATKGGNGKGDVSAKHHGVVNDKDMWSVLKSRMVQRFAPHHPVDTITLSTQTMQRA